MTPDPVRGTAGGDPLAVFEEFPKAAIDQAIPARFEEQVRRFESAPPGMRFPRRQLPRPRLRGGSDRATRSSPPAALATAASR